MPVKEEEEEEEEEGEEEEEDKEEEEPINICHTVLTVMPGQLF